MYTDRVLYTALQIVTATAAGEYEDYRALDSVFEGNDVDPAHVAWSLATMLVPAMRALRPDDYQEIIASQLESARLVAELDLGDDDDTFAKEK